MAIVLVLTDGIDKYAKPRRANLHIMHSQNNADQVHCKQIARSINRGRTSSAGVEHWAQVAGPSEPNINILLSPGEYKKTDFANTIL